MVNTIDITPFAHLYPFGSHYLNIKGLDYHYLDEGSGDPMLMVHGNPTWSFYFRALVTAFSKEHRIIVPDHIGCGLSAKPAIDQYPFSLERRVEDLSALVEHLSLDRPVTLIVHDWGGMIGLAWARENLDKVARIVIMNTAGFFPPQGKTIPKRLQIIRSGNTFVEWMVLGLNLFAKAAIHMAPHRTLPADVKAGLIAPYNTRRHRLATLKFVQDIPLNQSDPSGRLVAKVTQELEHICARPCIILWGARDFVFDRDYFDEWKRRLPNVSAQWFDNAGHYLLEDIPDTIISNIRQFLHQHPSR